MSRSKRPSKPKKASAQELISRASETLGHYAAAASDRRSVTTPEIAITEIRKLMTIPEQEAFVVAYTNAHGSLLHVQLIALGTAADVSIHPRDVFRTAFVLNAIGIIIAHNHPSGRLVLSEEDKLMTRRIGLLAKIHGIVLLDSIVFSSWTEDYYSAAERWPSLLDGETSGGVLS